MDGDPAKVQSCVKCARANPPSGAYCYSCGFALGNADRRALSIGSQPFNSPFVFPTGKTCRSFDELALACQDDWKTALGLLKDGYLETFLGGLGRIDLALAAKEASRFPDPDRGLDQLLGKLPSTSLGEPKLRVDPAELSLGTLDGDAPRTLTLELENQGMRLLYGSVTSDVVWLTLGDGAGSNEKAFHFLDDQKIAVTVRPDRVSASSKPVEGKLTVSSNGGTLTVHIRVEKPVKPFPKGPMAGAMTPRQIAEKAKANAREVGPYFENGDVEQWYATNGWTYPVKVPAASGLAAIQQFFEALGLTKAPKVELGTRQLAWSAAPGEMLTGSVEISTQEKKPIFAHVTSSVPWVEVGKAKLSGQTVSVPVTVPSVPSRPGEMLHGELTVVSNGSAKWAVPVTIDVAGAAFDFAASAPPPPPLLEEVPVLSVEDDEPPLPVPTFTTAPPPPSPPPPPKGPKRPAKPVDVVALVIHALPALALVLAVGGVAAYDRLRPDLADGGPTTTQNIAGPRYDPKSLADPKPRLGIQYSIDQHFGISRLDQGDPSNPSTWKRLTFHDHGETNNTIVKVAGRDYPFGFLAPGRDWAPGRKAVDLKPPYTGRYSVFRARNDGVEIMQYVQVVPGQTNVLDTALIYYRAYNSGTVPQKVGLRLMLDTFIGNNDGVPFLVPGKSDLVRHADLTGKDVPDYLEVIENPNDPKNPGTVVRMGLKGIRWGTVEPIEPDGVMIGQMDNPKAWKPELRPITNDSCVFIYWPETEVPPKTSAHFAMTYGLGALEISNDLAISAPGTVAPGREFTVTGYVYKAKKGQTVTLDLPRGLELSGGDTAEKKIEADAERAQVFWKVRGREEKSHQIHASTGKVQSRPVRVTIKASSIFG